MLHFLKHKLVPQLSKERVGEPDYGLTIRRLKGLLSGLGTQGGVIYNSIVADAKLCSSMRAV